jgi:hypothetical protein
MPLPGEHGPCPFAIVSSNEAIATASFLRPLRFNYQRAFAPHCQRVLYVRRGAPKGMLIFTVYIRWEASRGIIIRGWQPQAHSSRRSEKAEDMRLMVDTIPWLVMVDSTRWLR